MTIQASAGPEVIFGQQPSAIAGQPPQDYNADPAPSLDYAGRGFLDARYGYNTKASRPLALGFQGYTNIPTLLSTPSTASTSIYAAAQAPTTAVPLVLATQSTTGLVVLGSAVLVFPSMNTIPVGALAVETLPGQVTFSTDLPPTGTSNVGGIQLYDPTKAVARNVRIQTNVNDTGSYLVKGNDIYGYAMSESIAGTTSTTGGILSGKKAFKFIQSITPTGTISSTSVSAGTGDTFGLPIRADGFNDMSDAVVGNTTLTVSTGFTAAVTSAANPTSGDVRGTYALQTASNGSNILAVYQTPRTGNIGSITGIFGVTQA
jgi:hypothetical protein